MRYHNHKKAQAVVELALFGSLILFVFGVLLSYLQRMNDQQYVQMETFRRALQKGCTYLGNESEGAGASVQLTLLQNRRLVDIAGGFRKGSSQTFSGSSSVFWAVPKVGEQPESIMVFRVNEDERQISYRDYIPEDQEEERSLRTEDINSNSTLSFRETVTKQEDNVAITNAKSSWLQESVTTIIPYTIREKDNDDDDDNDRTIDQGEIWNVTQYLYRDNADGQYKYSSQAPTGREIERYKIWRTRF